LVGHLPLALHLAGSFLRAYKDDVTPKEYMAELETMPLLHHDSLTAADSLSPTKHLQSVHGTFALSFRRLDARQSVDGLALALLARAAHFAPGELIPREWLRAALDGPPSARRFGQAVKRLVNLGLLESQAEGTLRLHRLLAAFVLNEAPDAAAQQAVERVVLVVSRKRLAAPSEVLLPHLRTVADRAAKRKDALSRALCDEMGLQLQLLGSYTQARPYFEQVLAIREQVLGPEHPDTATSLNNLALLLKDQGDYEAARPLYERVLTIWWQVLGPKHPWTVAVRNNLAMLPLKW
jgi:tetratricopeptide (TPR) repeat protein